MELYEYEREHRDLLRRLAPECMVLLKSDGTFPLEAPCKVALYGSGARETIKGGTGSGDVNVRHYTTVEEGLENAGFTVTTKPWLEKARLSMAMRSASTWPRDLLSNMARLMSAPRAPRSSRSAAMRWVRGVTLRYRKHPVSVVRPVYRQSATAGASSTPSSTSRA